MKLLVAVLALTSCTGTIGQEPEPEPEPDRPMPPLPAGSAPATPAAATPVEAPACRGPLPVPALRRLTRSEYDNTVRDLLGDTSAPARAFVIDDRVGFFENNAVSALTALTATQYAEAADTLARTAVKNRLSTLAPCTATAPDEGCARAFVSAFGKRAFRRPLADAEQRRLLAVYLSAGAASASHAEGIRVVMTAILQSPHFLNHVEKGGEVRDQAGTVALTAHEVASRLSYFLWNTMPDAGLLAAADAGKLSTTAEVEAQARRLLADTRARTAVLAFYKQWLSLDGVEGLERDGKLFPAWSSTVRTAMRRETEAFVTEVTWKGDGKLTALLSAPFSFVNASVAKVYDLPGVAGDTLVRTELDPTRRAGLLTQPSLLALGAHFDQTSPVHRGLQVRERFLCQQVPSPPPDADVTVPAPSAQLTTRQRFDQHRSDPYCGGCHRLLDPVGFGFENYDAIGRYRATENGLPVDASGDIVGTRSMDGRFNGAVELAGRLARSPEAHECFAASWLAYATGAGPREASCAVGPLAAGFAASGGDIKGLLLAVTISSEFLRRSAETVEVCR